MSVPALWPSGTFDLTALSEVVYYLDRKDAVALVERVHGCVRPDGNIALAHWLGETRYPLAEDAFLA